jgi:DNA-binding phage protein
VAQVPFVEVVEGRSDLVALARLSGVSLRTLYRLRSEKGAPSKLSRAAIHHALECENDRLVFSADEVAE